MPEPSDFPQSSWADEIEEGDTSSLPLPSEKVVGNTKTTIQYQMVDGKKVKKVRTYMIERKLVHKTVARRKALPKFGLSKDDRPGPNPQTTVVAEEIFMQFVANKDESEKDEEKSALDLLKERNKGVVKCRICKEDHWTSNCPYKDTLGPLRESLAGKELGEGESSAEAGPGGAPGQGPAPGSAAGGSTTGGKYVPPSRREGNRVSGAGETMPDRRRNEETAAIRVSNLSENTQDGDLQELFDPFGHIQRIFLARDKMTNQCKGFAFINYYKKEDAAKAISTLNGYGYDHLILNVEWAKPSGSQ